MKLEDKINPKIEIYSEKGARFIGTIQEAIQLVFKESMITSSWDRKTRVSQNQNKFDKVLDDSSDINYSGEEDKEKDKEESSLEKLVNREIIKRGQIVLVLYQNEDKSNEIW
jgi:hypothetical protein